MTIKIKQKSFQKEDSYRAYHMSIEKVQYTCRCIKKQLKKYNKVSDIVSGLINYKIMNHHN
jgi:hypothetical protein